MDAANLLASLRKTSGDALHAFLDREFARLPSAVGSSARHVLRALIFATAYDNETWQGSRAELASELRKVCPTAPSSPATVKRSLHELCDRGLITIAEQQGKPSVYRIDWRTLLRLQEPPLNAGETEVTRVATGHSDAHDPGHHSPGNLTRVMTRVTARNPMFQGVDPGHFDPGHRAASADVALEKCNSTSASKALSARCAARDPGHQTWRPIWHRSVDPHEWRNPDSLIEFMHECAVEARYVTASEQDRIQFAALVCYVARQPGIQNRTGLLTLILQGRARDRFGRTDWRQWPHNRDIDLAVTILKRMDLSNDRTPELKPDPYIAQAQAANAELNEVERRRRSGMAAMRAMAGVSR